MKRLAESMNGVAVLVAVVQGFAGCALAEGTPPDGAVDTTDDAAAVGGAGGVSVRMNPAAGGGGMTTGQAGETVEPADSSPDSGPGEGISRRPMVDAQV